MAKPEYSTRRRRLLYILQEAGMTVCGLTLAFTPLALWFSWSKEGLYWVLAICAMAMAVVSILAEIGEEEPADGPPRPRFPNKQKLGREFIDEMHSLMPLTYHHRRLTDQRIRNKMRKLREFVRKSHRRSSGDWHGGR